jgi:hypothetical protein
MTAAPRSRTSRPRRNSSLHRIWASGECFMHRVYLAFSLLLVSCSAKVDVDDCSDPGCRLYCEYGYLLDEDGCAVCECAPSPGCEPVVCDLGCPGGYQKDAAGCEICACVEASCDGPNPAGCVVNECPPNSVCDTNQGCAPSDCFCDEGAWACSNDCSGGVCVPVGACDGPNPAGCSSQGCPRGEICDGSLGCVSSECYCDVETNGWICTPDCSGGVCVPDPSGCSDPYPGGCIETGCPLDQFCALTSGVCVPTSCVCDPGTGTWGCTDDCGGGVCAEL